MQPHAHLAWPFFDESHRALGASVEAWGSARAVRQIAQRLLGGPDELAAARPLTIVERSIWALVVATAVEDLGIAAEVWPRLADVSFKPVRKMDVPLIFLLGRHDYTVPSPVAAAWFAKVKAPSQKLVWLEHSAHMPMVEEPGHFFAALLEDVLPLTKEK